MAELVDHSILHMKLGTVPVEIVCHLYSKVTMSDRPKRTAAVGLFAMYGSWHDKQKIERLTDSILEDLIHQATQLEEYHDTVHFSGACMIDESEESLQHCIDTSKKDSFPCPPEDLPVLLVCAQSANEKHAMVEFVKGITSFQLVKGNGMQQDAWVEIIRSHLSSVLYRVRNVVSPDSFKTTKCIRIFVAGDRSQVGKTSMCLGLLGSLVSMGYDPSTLAYIKPATQSESVQLVQLYCQKVEIPCIPIGPVVYYRGFTRAFLAGETETSDELLSMAADAVNKLARGKRVIVIDGVGFPSVGSICGTDNASVARACGYPNADGSTTPPGVIIIGPSGVGAAVDSFNLNATYFDHHKVPVLGGIFNKLSLEGFYSLENCRAQVNAYFEQTNTSRRAFGFVPLAPEIAGDSPMKHVDSFIHLFLEHVDVKGILEAAARLAEGDGTKRDASKIERNGPASSVKRAKRSDSTTTKKAVAREEIEQRAIASGAAPSA